jgi:hypothetical protein
MYFNFLSHEMALGKSESVCVMSVFRRGVNEIFALLGCYTALIHSYLRKFQDNLSVSSSRVKQSKKNKKFVLDFLILENGTYKIT